MDRHVISLQQVVVRHPAAPRETCVYPIYHSSNNPQECRTRNKTEARRAPTWFVSSPHWRRREAVGLFNMPSTENLIASCWCYRWPWLERIAARAPACECCGQLRFFTHRSNEGQRNARFALYHCTSDGHTNTDFRGGTHKPAAALRQHAGCPTRQRQHIPTERRKNIE